ncbi:hypothetical protein QQ045_032788 [Rhodiola kirilowii]
MAATCVGEMESLLDSFDHIYEDAVNAAQEIQHLKSSYSTQLNKCDALQVACHSLKSDNERLTKLYTGFVGNLCDQVCRSFYHIIFSALNIHSHVPQIDYRSKYESLQVQLKKVSEECLKKNNEGNNAIQLIEQGYRERIENLETQLRSLTTQKGKNEELIDHLRRDLASQKSHINAMANNMENLHHSLELKYQQEVQDLKDCLFVEQEEKNELDRKLQDLEKELLLSRMKIAEQQRDLNSNRNSEALKEKIMKLRKENEILKRKCKIVEDG